MKREIASDIRQQVEVTRSALREMENCASSVDDAPNIAEEEELLRRLQLQLVHSTADIDQAMHESRRKLGDLLEPSSSRIPSTSATASLPSSILLSQSSPAQPDSIFKRTEDGAEMIHEHSLSGASQHQRHTADIDSRFGPSDQLLHELHALTAPLIDAAGDWTTHLLHHHQQKQQQQHDDDLTSPFDDPHQHSQRNPELHRREAQSALYRKWRDDRARKIADLASSRDQHALRQAQHSMQRFQQTLATMQQRRT